MESRVEVDQRDLARLVSALSKEADGVELRRDLVSGLKAAVEPFAQLARGSILSMASQGLSTPSLRSAVAAAVKVQVRTSGRGAGVFVKVGKSGMPRGFRNAPKRLNSRGWKHPVRGNRDVWVSQVGKPGWFDDTMRRADPAAERAAKNAMDNMAERIDQRTKG
jgi:hypothetical protein